MHVKCCDVPDPAMTCKPIEKSLLIRSCENGQGIYPRRCDFQSLVGVTYDSQSQVLNFYESIAFSVQDSVQELRHNFQDNLEQRNDHEYPWGKVGAEEDLVWQVGNSSSSALYLNPHSRVDLYQVVATCGHYIVRTNRFFRNITDLLTGDIEKEYFET